MLGYAYRERLEVPEEFEDSPMMFCIEMYLIANKYGFPCCANAAVRKFKYEFKAFWKNAETTAVEDKDELCPVVADLKIVDQVYRLPDAENPLVDSILSLLGPPIIDGKVKRSCAMKVVLHNAVLRKACEDVVQFGRDFALWILSHSLESVREGLSLPKQ